MKKTLIALMAVAGVAMAENYRGVATTNPFSDAITLSQYQYGMDYTLSFTLGSSITSSHGGTVLTLAQNNVGTATWVLFSQQGRYVGLDNGNDGVANGLVDGYATVYTYDNISTGADGWFMDSGSNDGIAGYTVTITGDAAKETTVLTFAKSGKDTVTLNFNKLLDASHFNIGEKASASNVSFTVTPTVPEPTTATLSLLALCGLAARRRRK